jgi:hypothetical protein
VLRPTVSASSFTVPGSGDLFPQPPTAKTASKSNARLVNRKLLIFAPLKNLIAASGKLMFNFSNRIFRF